MNNYFKIHKLTDDRKEMLKSFGTLSHINAEFVKNVNKYDEYVDPKSVVDFIAQMKLEGKYCVFVASKKTGTERFLSWEEIEEKVISKRDSILEEGRIKLDKIVLDLNQQIMNLDENYVHANKTSLSWKLVYEAQAEAEFLQVHKKLVQHQKEYANGDFHLHVDGFHNNRVYHYVSADDFVL
jgi:hypothetical protein